MNLAVEPTVVGRIQKRLAGHPGAQRGTEHGSVQNSTAFPRNQINRSSRHHEPTGKPAVSKHHAERGLTDEMLNKHRERQVAVGASGAARG